MTHIIDDKMLFGNVLSALKELILANKHSYFFTVYSVVMFNIAIKAKVSSYQKAKSS